MLNKKPLYLLLLFFGLLFAACRKEPVPEPYKAKRVMLLYSCGYNNLSSALRADIKDICNTRILPTGKDSPYKVLVFSHLANSDSDWKTPVSPTLVSYFKDDSGAVVAETLKVFPSDMAGASAEAMHEVLSYVYDNFPSEEYGMIFSSHSTGWIPLGYTSKAGEESDFGWRAAHATPSAVSSAQTPATSYGFFTEEYDTKTIGAQYYGTYPTVEYSYEMEVVDFVAAIPENMHLKYLVMDACLAGGIEEAYELKDKVDFYAASQMEILSDGFPYEMMTRRLLFSRVVDVYGLCEDYYHHYADRNSSATISLVDCNMLEPLAAECKKLFEKYAVQLASLNPSSVQHYYRYGWHWFYDLEDILLQCGLSDEDKTDLSRVLSDAVPYKAATPTAFGIKIKHHSGLSMYLPCNGSKELNSKYVAFAWNKATGLVK